MKKLSIKDRAMAATANMGQQPAIATPSVPVTSELIRKPKTGPGAMAAFLERESNAIHENQLIKEELKTWEGATPTKKLDPTTIAPSRWANRHQDSFSGLKWEEFKAEIASAGGNVQPIKIRPIPGADRYEYEIIFGHRRHQACLELGLSVLALVESITDKALFEEMDRENRLRADLRPYEQGEMYKKALADGLYSSLRKLAESIGLHPGNVSTAIKVARLPEVILDAFPSRLDIQYRWALPLTDAIEKDADVLVARAKAILVEREAGLKLSSAEVMSRLLQSKKATTLIAERFIKVDGKDVATVRNEKGSYQIVFKKDVLSQGNLRKIEAAIIASLKQ